MFSKSLTKLINDAQKNGYYLVIIPNCEKNQVTIFVKNCKTRTTIGNYTVSNFGTRHYFVGECSKETAINQFKEIPEFATDDEAITIFANEIMEYIQSYTEAICYKGKLYPKKQVINQLKTVGKSAVKTVEIDGEHYTTPTFEKVLESIKPL
jgi:hypothetical protein